MKIVYASRTGNVESIVSQLGVETLDINSVETVSEDFILFTYTDGAGDIPYEVETFLGNPENASHLKGVVASGDPMYGEDNYCVAGDKIAAQFGVECLYKVENAGTPEDIEKLAELVK